MVTSASAWQFYLVLTHAERHGHQEVFGRSV